MTVIKTTNTHLALVRQCISAAAHHQVWVGDEDLAALVAAGHLLLAVEPGAAETADASGAADAAGGLHPRQVIALAAFYPEPRPASLPAAAPDRVYLQAVAFRNGSSPSTELQRLVAAWCAAPARGPRLLIAYGGEPWYNRSLLAAGCERTEEVIFFELPSLGRMRADLHASDPAQAVRLAAHAELEALAALDAACFDGLWHMGVAELRPLLLFGSVTVAEREGAPVGYLALTVKGEVAQVARLAVHPDWSGHGIGRQLLVSGLQLARSSGCTSAVLNTQASNTRSQALYRSLGFRSSGERFEVYTRLA